MVRFVVPYSTDKKLFKAYDEEALITQNDDDWICFLDGDTAFLTPDWGHVITSYTQKYPDTGLFTCYASRCHYAWQLPPGARMHETSILFHRSLAQQLSVNFKGKAQRVQKIIAGHLLCIQKKTWMDIRPELQKTTASKLMLGVDTKISHAIMRRGLTIRIMQSVYVLHYLRMAEGINHTNHLK